MPRLPSLSAHGAPAGPKVSTLSLFAWIASAVERRHRQALFERAIASHSDSIRRVISSYAPPGAAREDLEQEVMLALWEALARFEQRSSLRTYVLKITHNRCIDAMRRRLPQWQALDVHQEALASDTSRVLDARQRLLRVRACVRDLPVSQRQALMLATEGLSHAEIAEIVGVSPNAIAVRIHRARATLRGLTDTGEPS